MVIVNIIIIKILKQNTKLSNKCILKKNGYLKHY